MFERKWVRRVVLVYASAVLLVAILAVGRQLWPALLHGAILGGPRGHRTWITLDDDPVQFAAAVCDAIFVLGLILGGALLAAYLHKISEKTWKDWIAWMVRRQRPPLVDDARIQQAPPELNSGRPVLTRQPLAPPSAPSPCS
ncbi:hypothetical protein [Aquabacter sediminis]|uniref:hypothetical protein n=1 Tax=Aquabacter sediminis TaxID=3029197 RepID=UPI00237E5797|nr:hypothetical protein [Aquabacter sp. P-9]MDE1570994.1 hypothetical protein [Aquabacter sp. P-9]